MFAALAALDLDQLLAEPDTGTAPAACIISVGSGGRGCGKTALCWLIALTLSRKGHRTILLDSDLAAAGLYGRTRLPVSDQLLHHFLQRRDADINILPRPVDNKNLYLITGSPSVQSHTRLSLAAKQKILLHLHRLSAEYIVIDCGQGPSYPHLDLFLAADLPIVVARLPNSSLLESYQFIRTGFFRRIQHRSRHWPDLFGRLSRCGDITRAGEIRTLPAFLARHGEAHPHLCTVIQEGLDGYKPRLVINRAGAGMERRRIQAMQELLLQAMGITLSSWGEIGEDENIKKSEAAGQVGMLLRGSAAMEVAELVRQRLLTRA
ncbi:MAG TPA: hypothetical protein PKJ13_09655 [bacterium]|nr:hypothetical protein [bacterium]